MQERVAGPYDDRIGWRLMFEAVVEMGVAGGTVVAMAFFASRFLVLPGCCTI